MSTPHGDGFRPLNEISLVEYIKATPALLAKLGGTVDNLHIKEVGDGNLNFVYIVVAPAGSLVVKQVNFIANKSPINLMCDHLTKACCETNYALS